MPTSATISLAGLLIGETCLRISKQVNAEMGNPNAPVTGKRGGAVNIAFNAKLAAYPELVDLDCDLRSAAMKCAEHRHVAAEVLKTFSAYQLSGGIGIEGLWRRVAERIAAEPSFPSTPGLGVHTPQRGR
jgi:hypothetical protein